jgi:hypothetical protein
MELFMTILNVLVAAAVLITAVRMYLTVNKMWKRKHEKIVSESISIFAYTLAILVHLPFMFKYFLIDKMPMPAFNDALNIIGYSIIILIGTGFFLKDNRRTGFFTLLRRALRLESKESGDLIKAIIQPSGAKQIMKILQKVAYIDENLADEEIKLINDFANQWKLDIPDIKEWTSQGASTLLELRDSVTEYLDISPPPNQAAHLIDVITMMVKADSIVTKDEELILSEVTGMINNYVNSNVKPTLYHVLIVPQNGEQIKSIHTIFPNAELVDHRGGQVFVRGKFYSKDFADAICQKYISLGMFTIWEETQPS